MDTIPTNIIENSEAQMRKGTLEFCVLLLIAKGKIYASDILTKLKKFDMIVVEGTLYPLLSRLKKSELVEYEWIESKSGPPRKYYSLTHKGQRVLDELIPSYKKMHTSINSLLKSYGQNN